MNGIFGILVTHAEPLSPDHWHKMTQGMTYWAVDGLKTWQDGPVGLGCASLISTPEAQHESLPLHVPHLGLTITAGARLDNREALFADCRLLIDDWYAQSPMTHGPSPISDSLLILLAYQKWGIDCVHHFLGDWHFALWDAPQQRLFLARDHHGQTGLYYHQNPDWLAFASSKKALLALPDMPQRPNLHRLAETLISQPGDGIQTAYEGLYRLPPAHRILFQPSNGDVKIERYWFLEETPLMHCESDEAYAEGLLHIFSQAVSARLRCHKPLGSTLSGGLDSGSVTAMAARLLAQSGQRLVAYTSVPLTDTTALAGKRFGDEWDFAQQTACHAGNVEHIAITAEHISPVAGLERMLDVHDEPGHAAGNAFWINAILEAAGQRGLGTLLIGQEGNATISWTGGQHSLLSWLAAGDWRGFWQAVEREGRAQGITRSHVLRRTVFKPLLLPIWLSLLSISHRLNPWRSPEWLRYSALRQDTGRRLGFAAATLQADAPRFDPQATRRQMIRPGKSVIGQLWLENGASYGLEARDPTSDRRLLEFCLAVPDDFFRAEGFERWLLRRAMQGYLPDAVRLNQRRGRQAADLSYRILANPQEMHMALQRCVAHPLCQDILDLPRMQAIWKLLQEGATFQNNLDCGAILLRGLGVGLFLMRF